MTRDMLIFLAAFPAFCLCTQVHADVFAHRENVNVLNCDNASISAWVNGSVQDVSQLRVYAEGSMFDTGNLPPAASNSYITMDFGEVRNVRLVRMFNWAGYQLTNSEIRTSGDGVDFSVSPVPHTLAYSNATQEITLNTAVDTRYLRVIGTGYNDANRRWIVFEIRAFGDPGVLNPPRNDIDLVSSTGIEDGDMNPATTSVVMTLNGVVAIESATLAQWVDDAYSPLNRQVIYSFDNGEGFTLRFDRSFKFRKFAFWSAIGYCDVNADYNIDVSMDGANWGSPVFSTTTNPAGLKIHDLTPKDGRYIRFFFTNTVVQPNYINDVMVFGSLSLAAGTVIYIK